MNKDIQEKFKNFFDSKPEIILVIIYGSYARGTESEASDVDIAIAMSEVMNLDARLTLQLELSILLKKEVDLVDIASHILAEEFNEKALTMAGGFLMLSEKGMIDKNLALSLTKSIGFRNIAVREYDSLDMDIVYAIITKDLNVFYDFAKTVLKIIK